MKLFLLFFISFFTIYLGSTFVVVLHMLDVLRPFKFRYIIAVLYMFLGLAVLLGRTAGNYLPLELSAWMTRLGYFWMSLLTYMFVWSLIFLILRKFNLGPNGNLWRLNFYVFEVLLCLIIFYVGFTNAVNPKVVNHTLKIDKGVSLKVAQISDLHLGFMYSEKSFTKVVGQIEDINPDILLITGDFLENENSYAEIKNIGKSITKLNLKYGIWAVPGNHEYINNVDKCIAYMDMLGIKTLRDSSVMIDSSIILVGRDDESAHRFGYEKLLSLDEILNQNISEIETVSELSKQKLTILMTHQIKNHKEYEDKNLDLVVSGHTHHGQFFPYNLFVKRIFDIAYGLEKWGETYFYVTSGTGYWGPPFRIGTKSEIVVFEIVADS